MTEKTETTITTQPQGEVTGGPRVVRRTVKKKFSRKCPNLHPLSFHSVEERCVALGLDPLDISVGCALCGEEAEGNTITAACLDCDYDLCQNCWALPQRFIDHVTRDMEKNDMISKTISFSVKRLIPSDDSEDFDEITKTLVVGYDAMLTYEHTLAEVLSTVKGTGIISHPPIGYKLVAYIETYKKPFDLEILAKENMRAIVGMVDSEVAKHGIDLIILERPEIPPPDIRAEDIDFD